MTDPQWWVGQARRLGPGVALATAITLIAVGLGEFQGLFVDHVVVEPLVLALLIGLAVRAFWVPPGAFAPGIAFAAKPLLEFAIVVLGASLNLRAIVDAGGQLVVAVLISVTLALALGMGLGRLAGLGTKQSALIAVGNAICGNSAIAAVAP
ncbi:MAG TPA: putative sulfate exporter family transporter, partial [Thermomicrobiales bacterium]|nr:putative sulfate exporter family transporter [Thermomicrobiales bacterium]